MLGVNIASADHFSAGDLVNETMQICKNEGLIELELEDFFGKIRDESLLLKRSFDLYQPIDAIRTLHEAHYWTTYFCTKATMECLFWAARYMDLCLQKLFSRKDKKNIDRKVFAQWLNRYFGITEDNITVSDLLERLVPWE